MEGKRISHYKILEKLGEGGMGVVYKARDTRLDRYVALKFLPQHLVASDKDKQRFIREAKAAAALNHPNICTVYSIGEFNGQHFIVMEYIDGVTLRDKLSEVQTQHDKASQVNTLLDFAINICEALSEAHKKGIIHRDIKPENIMVDSDLRVKVMDFGLAKLMNSKIITNSGKTAGTIVYMSPEQALGNEIKSSSDLFSFGIILYEMITGKHPFASEYEQATAYRLVNEDPLPPSSHLPQIPSKLNDIILRCLEKNPDHRYQSAVDILRDLKEVKKDPWVQTTSTYSDQRRSIPGLHIFTRKTIKWTVGSGILIIMIGVILFYPRMLEVDTMERIPDEKGIVVLPFVNLSEETIPQSLNDGIMEILTSKITQIEMHEGSLWVVPSTEVRYQQVSSVTEASRHFGVNLAVTGSLHLSNDQYRLTINLIDSNTNRQLRSRDLDLERADFARLQDEIVHALSGMLELELAPHVVESMEEGRSEDSKANELYIEGRGDLGRHENLEKVQSAIRNFEEAIDTDPDFVAAYAGLGEAYWYKYELTRDEQWTQKAVEYGEEAMELDDRIPESYITMALIYNGMGRYSDALVMLESLPGPDNTSFDALRELAKSYEGLGQLDRAEATYKRAIEQKTTYWEGYNQLGVFYFNHGRFAEAVDQFKKVIELSPDNIRGFYNLGGSYIGLQKHEKARDALEQSLEIQPNFRALSNLGSLYFYENDFSESIEMYEQALEIQDTHYEVWGNLAFAYHWSGADPGKVNSTIQRAIKLAENNREITPDNPQLLMVLAEYYALADELEQTRNLLDHVISLDVQEPELLTRKALVYDQLGERNTALYWIEKALGQGYPYQILERLPGARELLKDPNMKQLQKKYE